MKHLLCGLLLIALFAASCSGDEAQAKANTENLEVVENNTTIPTTAEPELIAENLNNETIEEVVSESVNNTEGTVENNSTSNPALTTRSSTPKKPAPKMEITTNTTSKPAPKTETTPTEPVSNTKEKPKPSPDALFSGTEEEPGTTGTAGTAEQGSKTTTETKTKPGRPTLSHDSFDELLRKYVSSSGGVDYDGLKRNKKILDQYLELLKNNPPSSSWSKNKEMAYWINMYNAFTIQAIVEKYPINSITDLEGGKVWDKRTIVVAGKTLTLNKIEKENLLKRFKEPRVHFAVNCAAKSCPPLLNKAWTEDNVQRYLAKQAKAFINNTKENTISPKSIEISQIFNWYAGDFGGSDKVVAYFQKYSDIEIKNNAKVSFKDYKWTLNKK